MKCLYCLISNSGFNICREFLQVSKATVYKAKRSREHRVSRISVHKPTCAHGAVSERYMKRIGFWRACRQRLQQSVTSYFKTSKCKVRSVKCSGLLWNISINRRLHRAHSEQASVSSNVETCGVLPLRASHVLFDKLALISTAELAMLLQTWHLIKK